MEFKNKVGFLERSQYTLNPYYNNSFNAVMIFFSTIIKGLKLF